MNEAEREFIGKLKEHQRMIHKVCRIYTDNPENHDDLFQEICIQLWKSYGSFRGEAKFSTWMYQVCLNTAIALFRKSRRRVITTDMDFSTLRITSSESEDDSEKIKMMYSAIHKLSDIERALVMMYLDDKSYREISQFLGITEGNARVKMNRVKEKLKTLIKK